MANITSGLVIAINKQLNMVALDVNDGYSILESLGDLPDVGDVIAWSEINPLGSSACVNRTRSEAIDVFFQNHYVHVESLADQLLVRSGAECLVDYSRDNAVAVL